MLLVATVRTSTVIPEGTVLHLEVDELPQAAGHSGLASTSLPATQAERLDMGDMVNRYGVDARTIRRWVREKRVPYFKIGGKLFFHKADLDAKEAECKVLARGKAPAAIRLHAERRAA
jgi:excisionase family DNA binding protein